MKIALYCPPFYQEADEAWQQRWDACRRYIREHCGLDVIHFDNMDELVVRYDNRAFRRVVVARKGYYKPDFHDWVARNRIPVLDVMCIES